MENANQPPAVNPVPNPAQPQPQSPVAPNPQPVAATPPSGFSTLFIVLVAIILVVAAGVFAYFTYFLPAQEQKPTYSPQPLPSLAPSPSPSPEASQVPLSSDDNLQTIQLELDQTLIEDPTQELNEVGKQVESL